MRYTDHHYREINQEIDRKLILLPLGAVEQHGPHLAVSTDTDIVTRVAAGAERALPDQVLLCPTLPFGSSHHHTAFGGTISLSPELYTQVVVDLVSSFLENGFKRVVLLNGHGGNITPVKQALAVLSDRFDEAFSPYIALATYWELAGAVFSGAPPMESPALSHACEYETSIMLHLFPEKVWMDRAQRPERPQRNGYIAWEDDEPYRGVSVFKATPFITSNGSSGEPQRATAEKGRHLFDHAVAALVQFLTSFKDWPFLDNIKKER